MVGGGVLSQNREAISKENPRKMNNSAERG